MPTASPAPTSRASASPSARGGTSQSQEILLGGTWACKTLDGTPLTHTFSRNDQGTAIVVDTVATLPGGSTATLHERYRYQATQGLWTADVAAGAVRATSPGSAGSMWTFNGTAKDGSANYPIEMTFYLLGPTNYRRDFQREINGEWRTYAGETCHRSL